jgi:hypothetical protein
LEVVLGNEHLVQRPYFNFDHSMMLCKMIAVCKLFRIVRPANVVKPYDQVTLWCRPHGSARLHRTAGFLDTLVNFQKISGTTRQAVKACDNHNISRAQVIDHPDQLRAVAHGPPSVAGYGASIFSLATKTYNRTEPVKPGWVGLSQNLGLPRQSDRLTESVM